MYIITFKTGRCNRFVHISIVGGIENNSLLMWNSQATMIKTILFVHSIEVRLKLCTTWFKCIANHKAAYQMDLFVIISFRFCRIYHYAIICFELPFNHTLILMATFASLKMIDSISIDIISSKSKTSFSIRFSIDWFVCKCKTTDPATKYWKTFDCFPKKTENYSYFISFLFF